MKVFNWRILPSRTSLLSLGLSTATVAMLPFCAELRIKSVNQLLTDDWTHVPIEPRGSALLGISFRPLQAQAFGLEIRSTMNKLLEYPIQLVRLGAYWNRIEPKEGVFDTSELDWQIDAVERTGAKIILCVGALKTFGFPEYFIPQHYMPKSLLNGTLIAPTTYPELLDAAITFISRIVDRYKGRQSIIMWQLENEPADPLPFAHYWRLSKEFVERELEALRLSDRTRPIMINGGLITSLALRIGQLCLTRGQGDSIMLAKELSDIIGLDFYPRIAISSLASKTIYLDTTGVPWGKGNRDHLAEWALSHGKKVMVTEGQSEPWELTIVPPSSLYYAPYSCTPRALIENYNTWAHYGRHYFLYSYLFWGAEYWVLRWNHGDRQYLHAFARVLECS